MYRTSKGPRAGVDGLDLKVPLGGVHGFLRPNIQHTISLTDGLVYWAVVLLVVAGGSWLVFRRRDVT